MKNLKTNFRMLGCTSRPISIDYSHKEILYGYTDEFGELHRYSVISPTCITRDDIESETIDENEEFVNGFKVVQTSTGEFAYVKEDGNYLLPYRFDIAGDFNSYGFAMVGKDGEVSWINTEFQFLCTDGLFLPCETTVSAYLKTPDKPTRPTSFSLHYQALNVVYAFEPANSFPMPIVYKEDETPLVSYMSQTGEIVDFLKYDGHRKTTKSSLKSFPFSSYPFGFQITDPKTYKFDSDGHLFLLDKVLFARGFYSMRDDLVMMGKYNGSLEEIDEDQKRFFAKPIDGDK